ncbi:MAG TPA: DUF5916 domain-containing protein [Holophagaceae bacterium]|nr:DUF5916 domain-containing protein [Holophagaceae bacterium]
MRAPALVCLSATLLSAQTPNPPHVAIPRLDAAPSMARDADLSTWAGSLVVTDFGMIMPDDKGENRWPTTAHFAWGPDALYVAVECVDPEPSKVRSALRKRDDFSGDLDLIGLDIDASGKGLSTIRLIATPEGCQDDAIVTDATGENYAYDCLWDSVGTLTPTGYVVKFRVPYSSLRRLPGDWGLRILRIMPRERRYGISWPRMNKDVQCDICQMAKASGAPVASAGSPFMVIPSVTYAKTNTFGAPTDERAQLGVDVRYAGTSVTLEGTYRPDFATVDADVDPLQINSRFRVLYPEHRPFFLEGMELLGISGAQQQFFSRTVQEPLYGVKASGQSSWASWTVLTGKDQEGGMLLDANGGAGADAFSTHDTAAAARFRLDDQGSGLSVLGTDKELSSGPDGAGGKSGGLYLDKWIGPEFHFTGSAIRSVSHLPLADGSLLTQDGTATSLRLDWNTRHWFASAWSQATSPDLLLVSGFTDLQGYRRQNAQFGWQGNWNSGSLSQANGDVRWRDLSWWDGHTFDKAVGLDAYVETAGRWAWSCAWDIAGRTWANDEVTSNSTWSFNTAVSWKRLTWAQLFAQATAARTIDLPSGAPARLHLSGFNSQGAIGNVGYNLNAIQVELDRESDGLRLVRARELSATAIWQFPLNLYFKTQGFVTRYDGSEADLTDKYLKGFVGWQPNAFTTAYIGWSGQRHRDPAIGLLDERMIERGVFAKFAYAIQF